MPPEGILAKIFVLPKRRSKPLGQTRLHPPRACPAHLRRAPELLERPGLPSARTHSAQFGQESACAQRLPVHHRPALHPAAPHALCFVTSFVVFEVEPYLSPVLQNRTTAAPETVPSRVCLAILTDAVNNYFFLNHLRRNPSSFRILNLS